MVASGTKSAFLSSALFFAVASFAAGADPAATVGDPVAGRALFERSWTPAQGLGPLFNEHSCVACHSLGGVGGGGPNSKNVELLSVEIPALVQTAIERDRKNEVPSTIAESSAALRDLSERAVKLHTGLENGSMLLHLHGNDPGYQALREKLLGLSPTSAPTALTQHSANGSQKQSAVEPRRLDSPEPIKRIAHGNVLLTLSARNSTALFGSGLIDRIKEAEIRTAATEQKQKYPKIAGRFLGRFGWRGQTSTLAEFVAGACQAELGLETQTTADRKSRTPLKRNRLELRLPSTASGTTQATSSPGRPAPEINSSQFADLLSFVGSLPGPGRRPTAEEAEAAGIERGEAHFGAVGCNVCHIASLGEVTGIYSDLLLHDMGTELADAQPAPDVLPRQIIRRSGYNGSGTETPGELFDLKRLREWRTPPLWGLADSAPYLHDGRARTIEAAILAHGGQAASSVAEFTKLDADDRRDLLAFLSSLVAPVTPERMQTLATQAPASERRTRADEPAAKAR